MQTADTKNATLWKDLIEIPEHRSTFVLKLTDGLAKPDETVDKYCVTPSLAERFDQSLSLIKNGLSTNQSQGAFLHGSFGSGKSHFMAVLNLLLEGNSAARSIPALTDAVVKHDWMKHKKLLMVPYHMLGKPSMEAAILGGYVDYIEEHHPEERLPGVYLGERILENAEDLRDKMGDAAFFDTLNTGAGASAGGWGNLGASWTLESYQQALQAGPKSTQYERLVGDVVRYLLTSVRDNARVGGEQKYIPFEEGLQVISRHAKELGYDGLILFLDELILWLSGKSADTKFLRGELDKVTKLVESQYADRQIPIISFIARQRDLREMLGDSMIGGDRNSMDFSLEWWQGRFDTIELEDRNLPRIASQRLLRPANPRAKERILQSFEAFSQGLKKDSRDTMLTTKYDQAAFELVYPFSPALIESLVVLSSTLQRDRTALKLMQTLLIQKRDELALGDVIPVGDLWDVVSQGEEPTNDIMRAMMKTARNLWTRRLHPMLVREHGGVDPTEPGAQVNPQIARNYRNDARLLKTLLIAALVPSIEVFEGLTVKRLIALNHGTVNAPIPGSELSLVTQKFRRWGADITELSMEGTSDPILKIRLDNVDIEPMLTQANAADNRSNRVRKIKDLLYHWLELSENASLRADYRLNWRGGQRTVHITYGNIREMSAERLTSDGDNWLFIFDYPFDEGHSPADDRAALDTYCEEHPQGSDTIAWLPTFLDERGKEQLGRLLKIEDVLARFDSYAANLSPDNRALAKNLLQNNQRMVEERLRMALHAAFGLSNDATHLLDASWSLDTHLYSLKHGFTPQNPFGKSFKDALEAIAQQALAAKYPAAYRLPAKPLTAGEATKVFEVIRASIEADDKRAFVEKKAFRTTMVEWAEPLHLGIQGETHFTFKDHWAHQIEQALAPKSAPVSVGDIYSLLDPEEVDDNSSAQPTGLPKILKDLIVLSYAAMEDRFVSRHDQEIEPRIGSLKPQDLLELRRLPSQASFKKAAALTERILGVHPPRTLNARSVQNLASEIRAKAAPHQSSALQIESRLTQVCSDHLGMSAEAINTSKRHQIAVQMRLFMLACEHPDPTSLIEAVAAVEIGEHNAAAIKTSIGAAETNCALLDDASLWSILGQLAQKDPRDQAESGLLDAVKKTLALPEHVEPLTKLRDLQTRIIELIFAGSTPTPANPEPTPAPAPPPTAAQFSGTRQQVIEWLNTHFSDASGAKITISVHLDEENA